MRLEDALRAHAVSLGMHRVAMAAAVPLEEDHARYRAFVAAGFHGSMQYLAKHGDVRARVDSADMLEGTQTVIVCALAYHRAEHEDAGRAVAPAGTSIARYARGRDYHGFFRKQLRRLAEWIRTEVPGAKARAMVDTAPVLERAWARRAGLGFVGKNGMLIIPGLGSYVLLGEVLTTVALEPGEPMASRCGECIRCLDGCPTRAFAAPYVLDPRRCISYLTIEERGEIPESLRASMGDRLFGCDACQEVCPYNRTSPPDPKTTEPFASHARWNDVDLATLATMDDTRFRAITEGSPLSRPRRAGLVRNAVIVMANSRNRVHLPVLRQVAAHEPEPLVRSTARWAIEAIESTDSRADTRDDPERNQPPCSPSPPPPSDSPGGSLPRPPREA